LRLGATTARTQRSAHTTVAPVFAFLWIAHLDDISYTINLRTGCDALCIRLSQDGQQRERPHTGHKHAHFAQKRTARSVPGQKSDSAGSPGIQIL
jgi:hypothetical protein